MTDTSRLRLLLMLSVLAGLAGLHLFDRLFSGDPVGVAEPSARASRITQAEISPEKSVQWANAGPAVPASNPRAIRFRSTLNEAVIDLFEVPPQPGAVPAKSEPSPTRKAPASTSANSRPPPPPLEMTIAAPPVPSVAAPLPEPAAAVPVVPSFPYRVIGAMEAEHSPWVFLSGSEGTVAVQTGTVLDGLWQVESVDRVSMAILHKPSGHRTSLQLGTGR